jgi:hypothetical protein
MLNDLKNIVMGWVLKRPTIVVNNIIYVFCEKLRCFEIFKNIKNNPIVICDVGCLEKTN